MVPNCQPSTLFHAISKSLKSLNVVRALPRACALCKSLILNEVRLCRARLYLKVYTAPPLAGGPNSIYQRHTASLVTAMWRGGALVWGASGRVPVAKLNILSRELRTGGQMEKPAEIRRFRTLRNTPHRSAGMAGKISTTGERADRSCMSPLINGNLKSFLRQKNEIT